MKGGVYRMLTLHLLFPHRKNDLLTSKNNRNEKDREQFRSNRIRSKGR